MVFITGATGFLGSYILYYLLQQHERVRALKRPSSDMVHIRLIFKYLSAFDPMPGETWEQALDRVDWVDGDMLDIYSLIDALGDIDTVYHAAAIVSYDRRLRNKILANNIEGTRNLVNACLEKNVKKLAYVSSVAALGRTPGIATTENDSPKDLTFTNAYSESKYRAEMEVWRGIAEGLESVVICPGIILGWGNFANSSPKLFKTVFEGLKFYPTGSNAFVDARDVAKTLILLAGNEQAVNKKFIASGETAAYKIVFDLMAKNLGVKAPSVKVESNLVKLVWLYAEIKAFLKGGEPFVTRDTAVTSSQDYYFDNSRIKNLLGHHFISLEQTVADTSKVFLDVMKG